MKLDLLDGRRSDETGNFHSAEANVSCERVGWPKNLHERNHPYVDLDRARTGLA